MNRSELAKLVAYMGFTWPSFRPPVDEAQMRLMIDVWHHHLGDLDDGAVRAAVETFAASGREFAPGPGMVRRRVVDQRTSVTGLPDADAAWAEVRANIARVGWTTQLGAELSWSNPAIAAAVAAMGWIELCESTNEVADRAHFTRFYEARRERDALADAVHPDAVAVIAGAVKALEP